MRSLSLLLIASALAACTTAPQAPMARSAEAEAKLERLLAGKAAGTPMSCLPTWRSGNMVTIDDHTILFRDGANRIYRNDLRADCPRIGTGHYTLVTRTTGSSLCSGDIAQVVDLASGITVGSCVLGPFVPYTRS